MTEAISLSPAPAVPHAAPKVRQDLLDQLRPSLEVPRAQLSWQEFDGPQVEPHRLLGILQAGDRALTEQVVVWECADERWLGWGVASEVSADPGAPSVTAGETAGRFEAVRQAAASVAVSSKLSSVPPRWFGGFEFDPRTEARRASGAENASAEIDAWQAFGAGVFVLPQIVVRRVGERTSWFLAQRAAEQAMGSESTPVRRLSWLWDRVDALAARDVYGPGLTVASSATSAGVTSPAPQSSGINGSGNGDLELEHSSDAFAERIREVVDLIADGTAQKIVAADQTVVALASSPRLDQVLGVWAERAPESARFLFCREGVAFLGATPERLVALKGTQITSQALAGTQPKHVLALNGHGAEKASVNGADSIEQRLLESPKEQHEHRFVVQHIVKQLEPLCSVVNVHAKPRVLELHDLLHLQTPITATLEQPLHVLQLVQQLHPTPAVCGLPAAVAADWICQREKATRGWYSGPVGWFEPSGEGDFFVALRSMLLSAESSSTPSSDAASWSQARLFAGVGLVAGSEVEQEQREVATKLLTAGRTLDPWLQNQSAPHWRQGQRLEEDR